MRKYIVKNLSKGSVFIGGKSVKETLELNVAEYMKVSKQITVLVKANRVELIIAEGTKETVKPVETVVETEAPTETPVTEETEAPVEEVVEETPRRSSRKRR